MTAWGLSRTDIVHLVRAVDSLEAEGYSCWLLEELSVESLIVRWEEIPEELPVLVGEVELMASAYSEILALGDWDRNKPLSQG